MSLPREHQNSLAAFGWLMIMLAAGIFVWVAVMAYHNTAHAGEGPRVYNIAPPPPNSWVIVGEVVQVDNPSHRLPLDAYAEDHEGNPAKGYDDYHIKAFANEADCNEYLKTEKIKKFSDFMNVITHRWRPPGNFRIWCSLTGEPA